MPTKTEKAHLINSKDDYSLPDDNYKDINGSAIDKKIAFKEDTLPCTLSWNQLKVVTELKPEKVILGIKIPNREKAKPPRVILNNVYGVARAGELSVIMGSSGSGKTTLLNTLTGRNLSGLNVTSGEIRVNGKLSCDDNSKTSVAALSAYVQQDDLFVGSLSVKEHLWFNACLRMDRRLSDKERWKRINDVMFETGLVKCGDTTIGTPGVKKGLSGGEMKRLGFGTALLTNPSLMFCDEPTSGLDSFMAQQIVTVMQNLTKRGRTIICTIHQPSSSTFALFDRILLMAEGRVAYMGPICEMSIFFDGINYYCPENYNPADFYVKTLAMKPGDEEMCSRKLQLICDKYDESAQARGIKWSLDNITSEDDFVLEMNQVEKSIYDKKPDYPQSSDTIYCRSWSEQIYMLGWRKVVGYKRLPANFFTKIFRILIFSTILGILYWQQPYNQTGYANINGALFMLMLQLSFNVAFDIAVKMTQTFAIFNREHHDRTYCSSAFYVTESIDDLCMNMMSCTIALLTVYWMIGLYPSVGAFFTIYIACLLVCIVGVSIGHLGATACGTPLLALTVLPISLGIFIMYSGFLLKDDSVATIFKPLQFISPYRYIYEILIIAQWINVQELECEYESEGLEQEEYMCMPSGMSVIKSYQYDTGHLARDFGVCSTMFIILECIAMYALYIRSKKK